MIGETYSASGGMAIVAALGAIDRGIIPPTMNYKEKDSRCDLDYVVNQARNKKVSKVMINSFSPNGANTSIIIGRYEK
jgi:3-oxoacyl-[acyl-carrier-protein] synthase II